MMEEVSNNVGAAKHEQNQDRTGYQPRRKSIRLVTMYLLIAKLKNCGYIPFFINKHKRSEAALIQVIQESFVQGIYTRKMEKPSKNLNI